jgi:hypothetical protein
MSFAFSQERIRQRQNLDSLPLTIVPEKRNRLGYGRGLPKTLPGVGAIQFFGDRVCIAVASQLAIAAEARRAD